MSRNKLYEDFGPVTEIEKDTVSENVGPIIDNVESPAIENRGSPIAEKAESSIIEDTESPVKKKGHGLSLSRMQTAELVFISIISAVFITAAFVLYFSDLGKNGPQAISEFFSLISEFEVLLDSFAAPALICGIAFILFMAFRVMKGDDRKWLKAVLTIAYLVLATVILYFNWYYCEKLYAFSEELDVTINTEQITRHIMWANSVSCAVCFPLYYIVCVHFRNWRMRWDVPITLFMMTFIPVIVIVLFVVGCFALVAIPMLAPGWLIQKSVDSDLAAREADGRRAYTVRNESGCEETVYSDNGSDFYGADGSYAGKSHDGGKSIFR